jgi:hypothetical protein
MGASTNSDAQLLPSTGSPGSRRTGQPGLLGRKPLRLSISILDFSGTSTSKGGVLLCTGCLGVICKPAVQLQVVPNFSIPSPWTRTPSCEEAPTPDSLRGGTLPASSAADNEFPRRQSQLRPDPDLTPAARRMWPCPGKRPTPFEYASCASQRLIGTGELRAALLWECGFQLQLRTGH